MWLVAAAMSLLPGQAEETDGVDGHFAVNYVDIRLFGPSVGIRISF